MKRNFREEAEKSRDFIRYNFGGMIMTVVHERQTAVMSCGKCEGEFRRTCGKGFNADTEYFGFNTRLYEILVKRLGKDFLD